MADWQSVAFFFSVIGLLIYIYSRRLRVKNGMLYKQILEQDKLKHEVEERNTLIKQTIHDTELVKKGKLYIALCKLMKDEAVFTRLDIDRKTVANMLNTNEKYLFNTVKDNTGLSFSDYINSLRLNLAKRLLIENNNLTMEDIAHRSGFGSRSILYRQFREKYKLSPSEFKKAASEDTEK